MGKSSEAFLQLREMEAFNYDHTFTKKQAKTTGQELAKSLIDGGEVDLFDATGNLIRLHEVLTNALSTLKGSDELMNVEKAGYSKNGVKFSVMNTADRLDYEKDPVYKELKAKLKDRESKLKQAWKSDETMYTQGFDEETGEEIAVEIPKVGIKTFGKTTLRIEY